MGGRLPFFVKRTKEARSRVCFDQERGRDNNDHNKKVHVFYLRLSTNGYPKSYARDEEFGRGCRPGLVPHKNDKETRFLVAVFVWVG